MKKRVYCILVFVVLVVCVSAPALSQAKAGTSAAPELLIPVGASGVATAGATVSSIIGPEAIFWNPAGLDLMESSASALFSYRRYIADIGVSYIAVAGKMESIGSFGLTFRSFAIGDIKVTTEFQPDGTGEILSPTFFTLGLTYARQLTERVAFGVTMNIVSESFGNVSASGVAFDAGVQYRNFAGVNGLSLGVCIKNIGTAMEYDGSALYIKARADGYARDMTYYKVDAASAQMPSIIQIGLGYEQQVASETVLRVSGAFMNNNYGIDEYRVGGELCFQKFLKARAGYLYSTDPSGVTSIFQNITVGGGVNLEVIGMPILLDYAYVPVKYFAANHLFDIRINF
ncbi:MAG: PorV/PorQ family protein [Bacteroidetes bacterium]|nr:PorV/PorQ family protein [Bacteroidota bacterium]